MKNLLAYAAFLCVCVLVSCICWKAHQYEQASIDARIDEKLAPLCLRCGCSDGPKKP